MENTEKDQAKDQTLDEMQQQIEVAFKEWRANIIEPLSPPDDVKPLLDRILRSCFSAGVQVGIKIASEEYKRVLFSR